jgi:hypothetical protein
MNISNMLSGNTNDAPAAANRVSIRAVLAADGDDVTQALAQAGIVDPVAIPVQADPAEGFLGDGITPNLTGVLEQDEAEDEGPEASEDTAQAAGETPTAQRETAMLPPEYGMQALAPVRKRVQ